MCNFCKKHKDRLLVIQFLNFWWLMSFKVTPFRIGFCSSCTTYSSAGCCKLKSKTIHNFNNKVVWFKALLQCRHFTSLYIYFCKSRIWIKKQGMGAFIQSLTLLKDQIFLRYGGLTKIFDPEEAFSSGSRNPTTLLYYQSIGRLFHILAQFVFITNEYTAGFPKAKFWRFSVQNRKMSAVKNFIEKSSLNLKILNWANLSADFCPRLKVVTIRKYISSCRGQELI